MKTIKILFLAANPQHTELLEIGREVRTITEKIELSEYRKNLELVSAWAVRTEDLLYQLNRHKPHIVHFSGHGTREGKLLIEGKNGEAVEISPSILRKLFHTLKGEIRLVLLNACYSQMQAEAITQEIDCVIGMPQGIDDDSAIDFAAAFYLALGFGASIQGAFEQAELSLEIATQSEENQALLATRPGIDPAQIRLIQPGQAVTQAMIANAIPEQKANNKSKREKTRRDGAIPLVICYAQEDRDYYKKLSTHLIMLKRQGLIDEQAVDPSMGNDEIADNLQEAQIVLMLISNHFINSDLLYEDALQQALAQREKKGTCVIPIIVRDTAGWDKIPELGRLSPLPQGGKPIANWSNSDTVNASIASEIHKVVQGLQKI